MNINFILAQFEQRSKKNQEASLFRFLQETIRGLWKKYTQNLATGRGSTALGRLGGMGGLGVGQKADQD